MSFAGIWPFGSDFCPPTVHSRAGGTCPVVTYIPLGTVSIWVLVAGRQLRVPPAAIAQVPLVAAHRPGFQLSTSQLRGNSTFLQSTTRWPETAIPKAITAIRLTCVLDRTYHFLLNLIPPRRLSLCLITLWPLPLKLSRQCCPWTRTP